MLFFFSARLTPVKFMFRRRGCITFTIQKSIDSSEEAFGKHFDELISLCDENEAEDCGPVQSDEAADLFQVCRRFLNCSVEYSLSMLFFLCPQDLLWTPKLEKDRRVDRIMENWTDNYNTSNGTNRLCGRRPYTGRRWGKGKSGETQTWSTSIRRFLEGLDNAGYIIEFVGATVCRTHWQ